MPDDSMRAHLALRQRRAHATVGWASACTNSRSYWSLAITIALDRYFLAHPTKRLHEPENQDRLVRVDGS